MTASGIDLEEHVRREHAASPVSDYIKEIVYGATDGIVTTFAVVAGFAGAQATVNQYPIIVVLLFGLANLAADGASMGLSNFLSLRAEQDYYRLERGKELHEIRNNKNFEYGETVEILRRRGFSDDDAQTLTEIYQKNDDYWADFMMHHELELPNPLGENPYITGFMTFLAFVLFGSIPLTPYIFAAHVQNLFTISCIATFFALFLLGVIRWRVTKHKFIRSVGEIVLVGSVAASLAFFVGTFFRV